MKKNVLSALVITSCMFAFLGGVANASIAGWEDCISFNNSKATVKKINGDYKIVDGSHWMFSFGKKVGEAKKALRVIKAYKMNSSCFVGRPGPSMKYLLSNTVSPVGAKIAGEDCISFNNANTRVKFFPAKKTYKIVDGNMWMLDFGMKKSKAYKSLRVIKKHKFNQQCFVGRPGPSFTYWKKKGPFGGQSRPDLGAYGFLKIGQNKRLVKWGRTIVLRPGDEFLVSNGIPAFNLYYSDKNYGKAKASGYKNAFYLNGRLVSQQTNRSMNPGQKKNVHTQAYLRPLGNRVQTLELRIDDGNKILESRENNNKFKVYIKLSGF